MQKNDIVLEQVILKTETFNSKYLILLLRTECVAKVYKITIILLHQNYLLTDIVYQIL